jgi:hypothetical protein
MRSKRITKTVAEEVAAKLCKPIYDKIEVLRSERSALIISLYEAKLPKELIEIAKTTDNPSQYFIYTSYIGIYADNQNKRSSYQINKSVLGHCDLKVDVETFDKINSFEQKISKLKSEAYSSRNNLTELIFKYNTYINLKKGFPEAYNLLPTDCLIENGVNLPSINYKSILDNIQNLSK